MTRHNPIQSCPTTGEGAGTWVTRAANGRNVLAVKESVTVAFLLGGVG